MTPDAPNLDGLFGPYPPRSARADLERIGERLLDLFTSLMPTLLHVLAHPDLGHARLLKWHERLPFRPILEGLGARFSQMRKDGLLGAVEPEAAALAFLAAIHSAALFATMSEGGPRTYARARVRALVTTLWVGFAPGGPSSSSAQAHRKRTRAPARRRDSSRR